MKTAIVSGANGFVGQALVRELAENGYIVYALHHGTNRSRIPIRKEVIPISWELDQIFSLPEKLPSQSYEFFFHLAWTGSSGEARADTALQLKNAQWTVEALRTAHVLGCTRFIGAGSIMEHETMAACYTQGNRPGPAYIYGGGKLISHIMSLPVAAQLNIEIVWASITNAYGVGELSPRLVNSTLRKIIHRESPRFTSGTQNYDFVYIDDVAKAFRLIAERGKNFHEYLIGSSTARPLKEFLLEMKAAGSPDIPFFFGDIPFTGINLPLSSFNTSLTLQDTGFCAQISFADGCCKTLNWLRSIE